MKTLGCLGCGAMGGALLGGWVKSASPLLSGVRFLGFDHSPEKVSALGAEAAPAAETLVEASDVLILAIKPQQLPEQLGKLKAHFRPGQIVVSIAAGLTLEQLREAAGPQARLARVMPNLPASIGKGVFGLCPSAELNDAEKGLLLELFQLLGLVVILPESKFSAFTAIAGCGPAYVCLFLEGLIEAGVTMGLPAAQARELATATFEGTATLLREQGQHPALLREQVCSPAGVTIQGVNHLERTAVRAHVADAALAAWQRDKSM